MFFCFSRATVSAVNCLVVLPPLLLQLPLCHTLQIKLIDWLIDNLSRRWDHWEHQQQQSLKQYTMYRKRAWKIHRQRCTTTQCSANPPIVSLAVLFRWTQVSIRNVMPYNDWECYKWSDEAHIRMVYCYRHGTCNTCSHRMAPVSASIVEGHIWDPKVILLPPPVESTSSDYTLFLGNLLVHLTRDLTFFWKYVK